MNLDRTFTTISGSLLNLESGYWCLVRQKEPSFREFSHVHYCQDNRQEHPTQKPEGIIERMVLASSNSGDSVLDPFCGSGTTLRVCQQLQRKCVGIDINPDYVAMTNNRLREPFKGFDSIDPRMKRIPLDLNNPETREEYIQNHIKWFLANHPTDIKTFKKEVARVYETQYLLL